MSDFTKREREAGLIYQDIPPDQPVEADHIFPKSKGGPADVANLQFLDPAANRAKSDHTLTLRDWQESFLQEWDRVVEPSFLCVAIPGGGKTVAALLAVQRFLMAGHDRRVLIVVPTLNLRRQWQGEAEKFGIKLQSKEFGTDFKAGFVGGVVTYQSLDTSVDIFRKICASAPTLVVMDEPHHCADKASWGSAARRAFELAARRLLLSGTPFRTDGQPIPFIRYDGSGFCLPDYRYDYPDALKDNVVRTLTFDYSQGSFQELHFGQHRSLDFNGQLSDEQASERLRYILNPSGDFITKMVNLSHAKLSEIRRHIPDAAAMAVCMDIMHAQRVAEVIRQETGCEPSIVVSDEDVATDTVDRFRYARSEWLISVRQVSEGTDIKRMQVLCYLTNAVTELIFRQLIGRVSRVRYQEWGAEASEESAQADLEAFVFLPADPRLIEHAQNIETAQLRALKELSDEEGYETGERTKGPDPRIFLGSTHDGTDCVVISGRTYGADEHACIQRIAAYGITMEKASRIFEGELRNRERNVTATPAPVFDRRPKQTEEDRIDALRRKCNQKAFRYSKLAGCLPAEVHFKWPPQRTMGQKDLEQKLADLSRLISELDR